MSLVFALFDKKNKQQYRQFWKILCDAVIDRFGDLGQLESATFHFDYEEAAYLTVTEVNFFFANFV